MLGEARLDRRTERHEATKREILAAAWDLMREHGVAGLSLRDLARATRMQPPSLYSYFASKDAIYDALFAEGSQQLYESMLGPLPADPVASLREIAHRFFDFCVANPARYQLLFQRTIPGFVPSPEAFAPNVRSLESSRQALQAAGVVAPGAVDLWTALVTGLVDQQISNDPGGTRWARLVDEAVDMFLAHSAQRRKRRRT